MQLIHFTQGQDRLALQRSAILCTSKTKAPVGDATKGSQQSTQQGSSDSSLLATEAATLRQRLRRLAIVQEIADRNFDRDTFTRAHRAWLEARQELQDQFPVDVQRIDDLQLAGVEASTQLTEHAGATFAPARKEFFSRRALGWITSRHTEAQPDRARGGEA